MKVQRHTALIEECVQLDRVGRSREAVTKLDIALQNERDTELLFERAIRLEALHEYDSALLDYTAGIEIAPSLELLLARGRLLCDRLGRASSALIDFDTALRLFPQNALVHRHICLCYLLLSRNDDALYHGKWLVSHEPTNAASHLYLGECLLAEDRFNAAAKEFRTAANLEPNSANAWSRLSRCLRQIGQLDEAVECIQKSIELERSGSGFIALASLYLTQEKWKKAIIVLQNSKEFELSEAETILVGSYLALAFDRQKAAETHLCD